MVMKRRQKLKARAAALSGVPHRPDGVKKAESRGQRKRAKKRARREGHEALVREVEAVRAMEQPTGLRLDGLREALDEAAVLAKKDAVKGGVSSKRRKNLVLSETAQVKSVREHPVFKRDPVEALRLHLLNTVCANPTAVPPKPGGEKKKSEKKKSEVVKLSEPQVVDKPLALARDKAKERVREKRERKAEMANLAGSVQRRKSLQGVGKVRKSPLRGRIGVKRPKLLEDSKQLD